MVDLQGWASRVVCDIDREKRIMITRGHKHSHIMKV